MGKGEETPADGTWEVRQCFLRSWSFIHGLIICRLGWQRDASIHAHQQAGETTAFLWLARIE